jgi:hypothetical protein
MLAFLRGMMSYQVQGAISRHCARGGAGSNYGQREQIQGLETDEDQSRPALEFYSRQDGQSDPATWLV